MAVELEFYFVDRARTPEGCAQPPCQPLSGRREDKTQINSMADLDEYSAVLAAIDAAARPADGTALFFVATGAGDGSHRFSDTLREHEAAVRDYLAALNRRDRN